MAQQEGDQPPAVALEREEVITDADWIVLKLRFRHQYMQGSFSVGFVLPIDRNDPSVELQEYGPARPYSGAAAKEIAHSEAGARNEALRFQRRIFFTALAIAVGLLADHLGLDINPFFDFEPIFLVEQSVTRDSTLP